MDVTGKTKHLSEATPPLLRRELIAKSAGSLRVKRCVHDASQFALRHWCECWLVPDIARIEVYMQGSISRSTVSRNCDSSLPSRDLAWQALPVGKGTVLLLGNETAFQQAGTTQPEISCQSRASV